jgi:tellurite resistance protein
VVALLVLTQLPKFRNLPFALSWWALSFPVAGLAIASFRYATLAGSGFHALIGALALAALSVTVVLLLWRTTKALRKGAFFRPEA